MTEHIGDGESVRTSRSDPTHHTRLPRYARGAIGEVIETEGEFPLPDKRSRGIFASPEPVYAVRFEAADLFDGSDHDVVLALWQSYLQPAERSPDE